MSKEYVAQLEATIENLRRDNTLLKEELKRHKNANPSEALQCLDSMYARLPQWDLCRNLDQYNTIKQALLKAQEQEVVVKALQDGIYVKDMPREDLIKQFGLKLSNIETEWYLSNNIMCVNIKDYKTLFWLKKDKSE